MHEVQQQSTSTLPVATNGTTASKPTIERGASWSYGETKILLALWGQDMVQRQLTNSKRTKHVWEKIAQRIREHGYERTSDQVRTRVFNMIAEYRRILKNPTPERKKKCIFFDALHRIYQAKDSNRLDILNCSDEQYNFDPLVFEQNGDCNGGDDNSDNEDPSECFAYTVSPSGFNQELQYNGDSLQSAANEDTLPSTKRCRFDNPLDTATFPVDSTASALLIDRMFAHLSKETEVMREWVNLERERLAQEVARRQEEKEREERREKSFLEVLTKLQEQVLSFITQQPSPPPPASCADSPIQITSSNQTDSNK